MTRYSDWSRIVWAVALEATVMKAKLYRRY
jgi:hypothetical protein